MKGMEYDISSGDTDSDQDSDLDDSDEVAETNFRPTNRVVHVCCFVETRSVNFAPLSSTIQ